MRLRPPREASPRPQLAPAVPGALPLHSTDLRREQAGPPGRGARGSGLRAPGQVKGLGTRLGGSAAPNTNQAQPSPAQPSLNPRSSAPAHTQAPQPASTQTLSTNPHTRPQKLLLATSAEFFPPGTPFSAFREPPHNPPNWPPARPRWKAEFILKQTNNNNNKRGGVGRPEGCRMDVGVGAGLGLRHPNFLITAN